MKVFPSSQLPYNSCMLLRMLAAFTTLYLYLYFSPSCIIGRHWSQEASAAAVTQAQRLLEQSI
eukprot:7130-Heterococcus_DN1.PRE.3